MSNKLNFKVFNEQVSGLEFSIKASGNPMRTKLDRGEITEKDLKRGAKLGAATPGSGHDCYLKGITVTFDVTAPLYWWKQMQRYHFIDFISSQSTMHRITTFDIKSACNEYVWPELIEKLNEKVKAYNVSKENGNPDKEIWYELVSNLPSGFSLTASMVTNYLQLKSIYEQRKNHKLDEWHDFIAFCDRLPKFNELTGVSKHFSK